MGTNIARRAVEPDELTMHGNGPGNATEPDLVECHDVGGHDHSPGSPTCSPASTLQYPDQFLPWNWKASPAKLAA
jgi:hypothetical protein